MKTIVQLTDCHLFADKEATLREVATWPRFERAVADVRARAPQLDALVITGDTAHDERAETYEMVAETLGELCEKVYIVPGNHDDRAALRDIFANCTELSPGRSMFHWEAGDWRVLGLDSHLPGEVRGELGAAQLEWLDGQLSESAKPTLLFLHHPPVRVASPWVDVIGLTDAGELLDVLSTHDQVRLVVTGHVHQDFCESKGSRTIMTSPAVALPFRPLAEQLIIDPDPPSYRIFELHENGAWNSHLMRCWDA